MARDFLYRHVIPVARRLPASVQRQLRRLWRATRPRPDGPAVPIPDGDSAYRARINAELAIYSEQTEVHDLPAIYHYWSNRYLRPKFESFGFSNPDQFFAGYLERASADASGPARFVSIGAGNCDTEVRVARLLVDRGIGNFVIECLELNPRMLERGRSLAREQGVQALIVPLEGDFNRWTPQHRYDAVIANQSLHHVSNLESLFEAVRTSLTPSGRFIISDMIGRNGHQRWPEALAVVQEFWSELPAAYRYNRQLRRQETTFLDWDCSQEGFEGIRAEDILPMLIARFKFEFFLGFANVIDPFIDRSFGHHFDPESPWDCAFIDRVHARDETELLAGHVTPTHMIAVVRNEHVAPMLHWAQLTPEFCVRQPTLTP